MINMWNFRFCFICFIICSTVQAQKSWSLETYDRSVIVTNFQAFDQDVDSVVIKHKDSRLRLISNSFCENRNDKACQTGVNGISFISDIEPLDDKRTILTSFEKYPDGVSIQVIIYNKDSNDIDKWLVLYSTDIFFQGIIFYFLEESNSILIPKGINKIEEEFIYDVNFKNKTFEKISAINKDFKTRILYDLFEVDNSQKSDAYYEVALPIKNNTP